MTARVHLAEVTPDRPPVPDPVARVAVLVSLNFPDLDDEVAALVRRFTRVALETLLDLGAVYDLLDTSTALPDPEVAARYDGLLLLGGGDIDSRSYGGDGTTTPSSYGVDLRADRDALAAFAAAEDSGTPVLGVCRGAQLVNVARGGTLVADLHDWVLHRGGPGEPMFVDEKIDLVPGSRLHAALGADRVVGRGGHHQAVDRLGRGLRLAARAPDGVVEGFEDPDRWVVGVQWHPEDDDGPHDDRHRLFGAFVAAAAAVRQSRAARAEIAQDDTA